jgi:selenocysteine lyase/cysteine desulfurase
MALETVPASPFADHFAVRGIYLNTAAVGLPPREVTAALHEVIDRWALGEMRAAEFDAPVVSSRAAFARLVGVSADSVAINSTVSSLVGLIAASLPKGSVVVCAEDEFTSLLFPFLVRQQAGEITVKLRPLDRLVDAIDRRTTLVAVSAVQSCDGRVFDADGIEQACRQFGTQSLIDATQAVGWLPFDAKRFDYVVAGGYKWLLGPRGTAFLAIRPERIESLTPRDAGWYAGEDVWQSIYGAPLRLASSARRFDVSPAWFSWLGCARALSFVERVGIEAIHAHDARLSSLFLERLDRAPTGSAIVSVPGTDALGALGARGVAVGQRRGATRLSFHLYNTEADVLAAADVVRSLHGKR